MFNIKKFLRLAGKMAMAVAMPLLAASCSDDLFDDGLSQNPDGTFGPFDLEIPIDMERSDNKTRATFSTDELQIKNIWIAMFDTNSGRLVAMNDTVFNPSDASGDHANGSGLNAKLHSIMFGDDTPTAYLVGVANFDNIIARNPDGSETTLYDALYNVKNIKDFKDICIDTGSAERAMQDAGGNPVNAPLMSGLWGTQHGNYTVNLSGVVYSDKVTGPDREHTQIPLFDPDTKKVTAQNTLNNSRGMIHLRRLYAHINTTVNFNPSYFTTVRDPEIEVFNMPRYTFLQEHKTVENVYAYNSSSWTGATHNAAYLFPGSNANTGVIRVNESKNMSDGAQEAAFVMNPEDVVSFNEAGKQLKFGYWHYETKHWGIPDNVKNINDRERRHPSGRFSSLCNTDAETDAFNNDAPYFIVRAYVETSDGYAGNAEFLIHEGYCCTANSVAATTEAEKAIDFSTFRNTNYTYTVDIQSINGFKMKVESEDLSGDDYYHGAGGEMWSSNTRNVDVASSSEVTHRIEIPEGEIYWCIREGDGTPYGVPMDPSYAHYSKYAAYPQNVSTTIDRTSAFFNNIRLDGYALDEVPASSSAEPHTLTFTGQTAVNGYLYLIGVQRSADGTASYYTVYCFNQDGSRLDTPVVLMPNAPASGNVIIGIDDHTIQWKKIAGADSYTITLENNGVGGGYSRTLAPGQTINDDGYNITLKEVGDMLEFQVRFARSKSAMLSLVDEGSNTKAKGTISVVANNSSTGAKSKPGSVTKTFINPYWDFSSAEWKNGLASVPKDPSGGITDGMAMNQNLTINGLTMYTGNSNKMAAETHGSYNSLRPNGTGSTTNRGFKFKAAFNGKINVWTSSASNTLGTNASNSRYLVVSQYDGSSYDAYTENSFIANGTYPGTIKQSPNISVDPVFFDGDNVFIYNTGDILYYRISFTPQDR